MIRSVRYLSRPAFIELPPSLSTAVISMTEPGEQSHAQGLWGAVLHVQCCDAEYDQAMLDRLYAKRQAFDPIRRGFPSPQNAIDIIRFIDRIEHLALTELLVHCHSGRRRSAAVAKYVAERYALPFDHSYEDYNKTVYTLLRDPDAFEFHQKQTGVVVGFLKKIIGR